MVKLNCFVACAFGKDDVDDIYENGIIKVLKSLDINPIRVDKVDFLGKIDSKIIELIKKSDFCIADLTYARPSVYYEAGFAEGLNKKVIYTVNQSHFHHKEDDIHNNFKVHFDLSTQNIIGWKGATDNFKNQLARRINVVIKPILEEAKKKEKDLKEQVRFKSMSISKRIKVIERIVKEYTANNKYETKEAKINLYKMNNGNSYIQIATKSNYTKSWLEKHSPFSMHYKINMFQYFIGNFVSGKNPQIIFVLNSLSKLNTSTIEKAFPDFDIHPDRKEYTYYNYPGIKSIRYIFIDDIKSETDYRNKLALIKGL